VLPDQLKSERGMLARWFGFQPSEIDALEVEEFRDWCLEAALQIRREQGD